MASEDAMQPKKSNRSKIIGKRLSISKYLNRTAKIQKNENAFLLMAQYDARPIIPLEWVQRDFFSHIDVKKLALKCATGEIQLPLIRIDPSSQKSLKGVGLEDLALYLDVRQRIARKELSQIRPI
ncbi:pyocin activator PrtN family protein [Variovorax sp. H27-G14]|uniref:pyocin activator PrtN family protein n=1 Tax=Variovorax sp. H27-G14 TaxID=3111914 RepID=UPI0038FC3726